MSVQSWIEFSKLQNRELSDAVALYLNATMGETLEDKFDYFLVYACRSDNLELKQFGHCLEKILEDSTLTSIARKEKFPADCKNLHTLAKDFSRTTTTNQSNFFVSGRGYHIDRDVISLRAPSANKFFFDDDILINAA